MDVVDIIGLVGLLVSLGAIIGQWAREGPGLQGGGDGKG